MLNETNLKTMTGESDIRVVLQKFIQGREEVDKEWEQQQISIQKMDNMGETAFLEILPLQDFYASREDLKIEAAVSYLIKTEKHTVLFDLGDNSDNSDPSPLLQNMEKIDVSLQDVDSVVISHNHCAPNVLYGANRGASLGG